MPWFYYDQSNNSFLLRDTNLLNLMAIWMVQQSSLNHTINCQESSPEELNNDIGNSVNDIWNQKGRYFSIYGTKVAWDEVHLILHFWQLDTVQYSSGNRWSSVDMRTFPRRPIHQTRVIVHYEAESQEITIIYVITMNHNNLFKLDGMFISGRIIISWHGNSSQRRNKSTSERTICKKLCRWFGGNFVIRQNHNEEPGTNFQKFMTKYDQEIITNRTFMVLQSQFQRFLNNPLSNLLMVIFWTRLFYFQWESWRNCFILRNTFHFYRFDGLKPIQSLTFRINKMVLIL